MCGNHFEPLLILNPATPEGHLGLKRGLTLILVFDGYQT